MTENGSGLSPLLKYGIMGFVAGILGALLSIALGFVENTTTTFVTSIIGCTAGGLLAGWMKKRRRT